MRTFIWFVFIAVMVIPFRVPAFEVIVSDSYRDALYRMEDVNGSGIIDTDEVSVIYDDSAPGPDLSVPVAVLFVEEKLYLLDGGSLDTIAVFQDMDSDTLFLSENEFQAFYGPECSGVVLRTPKTLDYADEIFVVSDDSRVKATIALFQDFDGDGTACLYEESMLFYDSNLVTGPVAVTDPEALCIVGEGVVLVSDASTGMIYRLQEIDGDEVVSSGEEISVFYAASGEDPKPVFSALCPYMEGYLAADSENGKVLYLDDINNDGIVDAAESLLFCGGDSETVFLGEVTDLCVDASGTIWLLDNATDSVCFVSDWNRDGDALDPGEVIPVLRDQSVLARPVSIAVKEAPRVEPPVLEKLSVETGSFRGGDEITVTGRHFIPGMYLFFGDTPAEEVVFVDSETVNAVVPPGKGDVAVTAASVGGASTLQDAWSYTGRSLSVTGISPGEGASEGGITVTIAGSGFKNADVWFDGIEAEVHSRTDNEIVVILPAHADEGEVTVLVSDGVEEGTVSFYYRHSQVVFLRGDVDLSGGLLINDAVWILHYLFSSGEGADCMDRLDVNDEGMINLADPVFLLSYLFAGGEPPPPPFPGPGIDETADQLICK